MINFLSNNGDVRTMRGYLSQRRVGLLVALLILPPLFSACSTSSIEPEPSRVERDLLAGIYPGETWDTFSSPEAAGWETAPLAQARDYFEQIESAAVVLIYDGAVVLEWGEVERKFLAHSIRKSFMSGLYGIHVSEGHLTLNTTMEELEIGDLPPLWDLEKEARVIHLLKSTSGVYHSAAAVAASVAETRPARGLHTPGTHWWYNNWGFNALLTIFEQETGTLFFEEFNEQIAKPLQMEDFVPDDGFYYYQREYSQHPAYHVRITAKDMARYGLLFMRQGRWNNKQIIPVHWITESTASYTDTGYHDYGFGYMWWKKIKGSLSNLDMYSTLGFGGHAIDILPKAKLVFVHRANTDEGIHVDYEEHLRLLEMIIDANPELARLK